MELETGVLTAMAIGIVGSGALTGWSLWSRYEERKNPKNR